MYGIYELNMNRFFHLVNGTVIAFETPNEAQSYANNFYNWAMQKAMMTNQINAIMNLTNARINIQELPEGCPYVLAKNL